VALHDELSGAQVPPHVRIGDAAHGHGEEAQGENDNKQIARLQQTIHGFGKIALDRV